MASDGDLGAAAFINQPASTDPYSSVTSKKSVFFLNSGAVLLGNSINRATVDGKLRTGELGATYWEPFGASVFSFA